MPTEERAVSEDQNIQLKLTCLQDVCDLILPLAPSMGDQDIADLIITIHRDPTSGPDILNAYKAANPDVSESIWTQIYGYLTIAAGVASVITSIAGGISLIASL